MPASIDGEDVGNFIPGRTADEINMEDGKLVSVWHNETITVGFPDGSKVEMKGSVRIEQTLPGLMKNEPNAIITIIPTV